MLNANANPSSWTPEAMRSRLVRYADLQACRTAFIDTKTPGSTEKENFTIIGPGVSESPDQHVHIREKHGFNIGGARQPFGCVNSQHSHDTAEVFVVHTGHWRLHFGPNKEDGSLDIGPGDVASVPIHMFRGFSKLDEGKGFLWMPLGQDDPGKVTWAPAVFKAAEDHGLKLAKGGKLIDTTSGTYQLKELELEAPPTEESLAQLKTPSLERLEQCVARASALKPNPDSPLAGEGIEEAGIIVPQATADAFPAGPIQGWWPHDFNLRQLTLQTGAYIPTHSRKEVEVLFVQSGTVELSWLNDGLEESLLLGAGDTFSVPAGVQHSFRNTASATAVIFVVRGTENPQKPAFASAPVSELVGAGA